MYIVHRDLDTWPFDLEQLSRNISHVSRL